MKKQLIRSLMWQPARRLLRLVVVVFLIVGCSRKMQTISAGRTSAERSGQNQSDLDALATSHFGWKVADGVVTQLEFAPDDRHVLVSVAPNGENVKRRIVILSSADAHEAYRCDASLPAAVCFSPNGRYLAVLGADQLTLHDIGKQQISVRIDRTMFDAELQAIGFTSDGAILVGAAEYLDPEKDRIAWDTTTGETVPVPNDSIIWHGRGLSQDGTMFFSGGWPGPTPRIYKTDRTDRITYCFRKQWPIAASFTPDSKNLVTIHEDGLLVVWEIKETGADNARQLATAPGFDGCAVFAISKDGKRIMVATTDGVLRMRSLPLANTDAE